MAITPQAIKDQEFQVKLRGYDTVEVKAYLELIAEEFFELLEQVRRQIDELDIIVEERDVLTREKKELENELASTRGSSEEIQTEVAQRDREVGELQSEIDRLKNDVKSLENELKQRQQELDGASDRFGQKEQECLAEKERVSRLMNKVDELEKQNEELRSEEIDFKSTLVAAQRFTNDLKKKSEAEARAIVDKAKAEAEKLRQDTFAELAKYPAEIEKLKQKRHKVKEDLEEVLKLCLENLEIFNEDDDKEDYGELFQKVQLGEDELTGGDELDDLEMDFELPTSEGENDVFSMTEGGRKTGGDIN